MVLIRKRKVFTTTIQFRGSNKRKVVNSRHFGLKVDQTHNVQSSGSGSQSVSSLDSAARSINDIIDIGTDDILDPDLKDVRSRYEVKNSSCLQGWQEIRNTLYDTFISSEAPVSLNCQKCGETSQLYRCLDCMPYENVCESCLQNKHLYPHLHIFEAFRGETFVGAVIETPTWMLRFHNCNTTYLKEIIIVDEKGRQHSRQLQFCQCEAEAITLVRYRLWPSSTRFPKIAFHMELLKWLNGLLIECHVSVKGFCEALKARCSKHHRSYTNMQVYVLYSFSGLSNKYWAMLNYSVQYIFCLFHGTLIIKYHRTGSEQKVPEFNLAYH